MAERIFFTSDNHFYHKNILKFQPHTRKNHQFIDAMNAELVERWNDSVALYDRVYCLGDFSFGNPEKTADILKQLKGRLILIKGNHDHWLDNHTRQYFESVHDYLKVTIDGKKVVMFHFPIIEWDQMHHGSYHLYGHVHGNLALPGRAMDVGVDARPDGDMRLWEWSEIDAILSKREIVNHHGKIVI